VTETLSRPTIVELPSGHVTTTGVLGCHPLDVLIVTSEAPPIVSGISTCIERLATGLTQRGHRIRVLSSTQIPRVTVGEGRLSSFLAYWPRRACDLRNFGGVNVHGPVPAMSDAFLPLSNHLPSRARPAIVYTHHSPIDIPRASLMSARYNKLHEFLALRADRIVTSSQCYATRHRSRYGPLVRAIPWDVDTRTSSQAFVPRSAEKLGVLFVGQMRPYKGVETLLAAVAGLPWLELTLVGEGTELASYQRAEALGLVLLEDMAAGCVPVASDLPVVRDVADPTGVIVPPGDPDAPRQALRELAQNEARLEQLQIESWLAAQTRTWGRCVTSYEEVLLAAVRCRYACTTDSPSCRNWTSKTAVSDIRMRGTAISSRQNPM
jgi:glycosyltransferase involved in cell wall biosynthesis